MKPRVKICCISSREEAFDAIDFGASALGLVGEMPSGPGVIPDEEIFEIAKAVPPPIATFLLTSKTTSKEIIEHHKRTQTNTIQIVDELTDRTYYEIRAALPNVKLVQVIHVTGERSIDEAIELSEFCRCDIARQRESNFGNKRIGRNGQAARLAFEPEDRREH